MTQRIEQDLAQEAEDVLARAATWVSGAQAQLLTDLRNKFRDLLGKESVAAPVPASQASELTEPSPPAATVVPPTEP